MKLQEKLAAETTSYTPTFLQARMKLQEKLAADNAKAAEAKATKKALWKQQSEAFQVGI